MPRRPMPTHLRILHGDHPERVNRDEPKPPNGLPECPPEVSPAVREVWQYVVDQLAAMRVVSRIPGPNETPPSFRSASAFAKT